MENLKKVELIAQHLEARASGWTSSEQPGCSAGSCPGNRIEGSRRRDQANCGRAETAEGERMKKIMYTCDRCGKEVEHPEELRAIYTHPNYSEEDHVREERLDENGKIKEEYREDDEDEGFDGVSETV